MRFLRPAILVAAILLGLWSGFRCFVVTEMQNVYFRPVLAAVESGDGDPYMIALDCVQQLHRELEPGITGLGVAGVLCLVAALIRLPHPTVVDVETPNDT